MIMNILVILIVLGVAYAWMIRDAFSAFIHMLCVLIGGAIAFAFWEPLGTKLIEMSPERGFLSFIESVAFGVALLVPFAVSTILLRVLTDKTVPGSIKNSTVVDYALGTVFGVVTSTIVAGMLVIGIGSMRLSTNFFGYQPIFYSTDRLEGPGSLVRSDKLWVPVDTIVSKLYGQLSMGSMSSIEPLAKWYPELELVGFAGRISSGDGSGRNAISADDFNVVSSYSVGNVDGSESIDEVLSDYRDSKPQKYTDINSDKVTNGYLMGYVIDFEPGAVERGKKGGKLVMSNGHCRLVVENKDGDTKSVFPVATVSESSENDVYGRWRFDSKDVFITSVSSKSRVKMAFEFVVPQGYSPIALSVRNSRVLTSNMNDPIAFATPSARDRIIPTGALLKGESGARKLDTSKVIRVSAEERQGVIYSSTRLSQVMSTQTARRGLTIDDDNLIIDGDAIFSMANDVGRKNAPQSRKLRVEKYFTEKNQQLVRIDVSAESPIGFFSDPGSTAPLDQPLILIDDKGNEYEAIGYEYTDDNDFRVRYTRGSTLTGITDTPDLSKSRDDQKLVLLFLVTDGVSIANFTVGDTAIARFTPAYDPSE